MYQRFILILLFLVVGLPSQLAQATIQVCSPGQEQACPVPNGFGAQTCIDAGAGGTYWSDCTVKGCTAPWKLIGGQCTDESQSDQPPVENVIQQEFTEATPSGGPVAEEVAKEGAKDLKGKLEDIADKSEGQQESSRIDGKKINELGGNNAATVAAIFCAEGANAGANNQALSAEDIGSCVSYFDSAEAMNKNSGRTGFAVDHAVANSEKGQLILKEFEKNFGMSQEEYLARMLRGGRPNAELSDILSGKISSEKLEEAFEAGKGISAPSDLAWNLSAKKAAVHSSLRDKLKDQLAKDAKRSPASAEKTKVAPTEAKDSKVGHLEPFKSDDIFGSLTNTEKEQELSLFGVIRRKYLELSRRQSLVPQAR